MKKADIMLTFLFYTILGLVIFVPVVLWASQFLRLSNKPLESYQKLAEIVSSVKDNEILSMPFYMDKKSIIVGFSKNSNRFENHLHTHDRKNPDTIIFVFNRPKSCTSQKACICLCSEASLEQNPQQKTDPYYAACNKELKCKSFESIDLLSERIATRYDIGEPKNSWEGGFLHLRDFARVANGLVQPLNQAGTRTFYVQRYKGVVDVCLSYPCMTDETKKQIDLNEQLPI